MKIRSKLILGLALSVFALPTLAQDQVTLTLWHNHPEWKDRVQAILDRFEEEHPNIKIDLEELNGPEYTARINTALVAGEGPDLIGLAPGPETRVAAESGYIHDLTDLLDVSSLTEAGLDASKIDDKVYGVPVLGAYTVGLYYNVDIFNEHGITPPTTSDELLEVSAALKEKGVTPMIAPAQDGIIPAFLYMLLGSGVQGADGIDAIRSGERKFTDPDMVAAAAYLQELFQYLHEGAIGTPYIEGKALFALGQGAMMEGGSADYAGFTETNPNINLGVVPFPALPGGTPSTVTGMERIFAINKDTAHLDEAVTFVQWMLGDEPAQMVVDTITLSTNKNVVPSDNEVMKQMIEASRSNDVRVWYELPETGAVMGAMRENSQALFLGEMTPEEFAQKLQDAVDVNAK
jgi:raffinose/stachyose/melibiose transport system substrate-binding protein